MIKKVVSETMLALLIISMLTLALKIEPASAADYPSINVDPEYPYPWDEVNVTVSFTTLMISIVDFGEVIQDGNTFYVFISVVGTGYYYVETHTHTYHLGNLPVGPYEFIIYSDYDELDGITTLFIVGMHATPDLTTEGVVMPYLGFIIYACIHPEPDPFYYLINVTVTNQGTSDAGHFNVSFTVHLEGEIMPEYGRKKTVEGLQQGANEILLFEWDPQDYGNYTLTIAADSDNDIVELDETNNVRITWVIGTIGGDTDGDGLIGSADAGRLNGMYGMSFPFPPYPPADIDWDGYIGSADAGILNGAYGTSI